jgi:DNA-binding GntR family transcriptional regulator
MLELSAQLAQGLREAMARRGLPWCVTQLGARCEFQCRAALQRLAAEGALIKVTNAGVTVPLLLPPVFNDVLEARLLLEGTAAERGCLRLSTADVQAMGLLSARMAQALRKGDPKVYLEANEELDRRLSRASVSPPLLGLVATV